MLLPLPPAWAEGSEDSGGTHSALPEVSAQLKGEVWAPERKAARFVRFHVPLYFGGRFGYPQSVDSFAAGVSVDLWLKALGIEGGVRVALTGERPGVKFLDEDGSVQEPTGGLAVSYFRLTARGGAKAVLPIYGSNLRVGLGGGFAGGLVTTAPDSLELARGGYLAAELILGPMLRGKTAVSGSAGYVSVRIEQDFLYHPLEALGFQLATTIVLGFAPGGGGLPPGFLGP